MRSYFWTRRASQALDSACLNTSSWRTNCVNSAGGMTEDNVSHLFTEAIRFRTVSGSPKCTTAGYASVHTHSFSSLPHSPGLLLRIVRAQFDLGRPLRARPSPAQSIPIAHTSTFGAQWLMLKKLMYLKARQAIMWAHVPGTVSESQGLGQSSRHSSEIRASKVPLALAFLL